MNYPPEGSDYKYLLELRSEAEFYGLTGLVRIIDRYPWGMVKVSRASSLNCDYRCVCVLQGSRVCVSPMTSYVASRKDTSTVAPKAGGKHQDVQQAWGGVHGSTAWRHQWIALWHPEGGGVTLMALVQTC